ncbi:MAG: PEP-CTERM sorting domain-containing protein [Verrucomicrobiales bacterium]
MDYSGGGFGNTSIGFFSDITIPEPSTVILLSGSLLLLLTTRTRKPA